MTSPTTVLVVEDDRFLSSLIKSRLEREAFAVIQAFDGGEALEWLKNNKPDLILLDLIMPKVSGFEFLEQISIDPAISQIPVVILSNLGQEGDIQKAKQLGAVDYYVKVRTSIDDLVNVVRNAINQKIQ